MMRRLLALTLLLLVGAIVLGPSVSIDAPKSFAHPTMSAAKIIVADTGIPILSSQVNATLLHEQDKISLTIHQLDDGSRMVALPLDKYGNYTLLVEALVRDEIVRAQHLMQVGQTVERTLTINASINSSSRQVLPILNVESFTLLYDQTVVEAFENKLDNYVIHLPRPGEYTLYGHGKQTYVEKILYEPVKESEEIAEPEPGLLPESLPESPPASNPELPMETPSAIPDVVAPINDTSQNSSQPNSSVALPPPILDSNNSEPQPVRAQVKTRARPDVVNRIYSNGKAPKVIIEDKLRNAVGKQSTQRQLSFPEGPVETLVMHGDDPGFRLGIESVNLSRASRQANTIAQDAFAINPEFSSNYTITKVAKGSRLLKCTEYNFTTQTCFGEFETVRSLTPGQRYSETFTPVDPLFIEDFWWNTSFSTCQDVRVANPVGVQLDNHPVPIEIAYNASMQSDFDDIRFVSESCGFGGVQLGFELEYYNSSHALFWVNLDVAASGSDISYYFGNSTAVSASSGSSVFSAYDLVYHMDSDGNDSSGKGNTRVSDQGTPASVDGILGWGMNFSSGNAWDQQNLALWEEQWSFRTHEYFVTTSSDVTTRQALIAEGGGTNGYLLYILNDLLYTRAWSESDGWSGIELTTAINASTNYHIVTTFDSDDNYSLYLNGQLVNSTTPGTGISSHTGDGGLGYSRDSKDFHDGSFSNVYFEGLMHEFRIVNDVQSANFVQAQNAYLQSSQVSFGEGFGQAPKIRNSSFDPETINRSASSNLTANITWTNRPEFVAEVNATLLAPNGSNYTYNLVQGALSPNTIIGSDQVIINPLEEGLDGARNIGETGTIELNSSDQVSINFTQVYTQTPVIIGTIATQNDGVDAGHVFVVRSVNLTGALVSMCIDDGSSGCNVSSTKETFHYFVFDSTYDDDLDWLDVGTITGPTDGSDVIYTYNNTFTNTPYVFVTMQTYNDDVNIAPGVWTDTSTSTQVELLACKHSGTSNGCQSGGSETFGVVSINPVSNNFTTNFQFGSADISNSAWTAASFSPSLTTPRIMVSQNDDDGIEDPQYHMARSVTTTGADFRYCEQDAYNDCDTHTGEIVRWFAFDQGNISVTETVVPDYNSSYYSYQNVVADNYGTVSELNITLTVDTFTNNGSANVSNALPYLDLEIYNGTGYELLQRFNSTGTFVVEVNDSTILSSWAVANNRDLRVRAYNLDTNGANRDSISWSVLSADLVAQEALPLWESVVGPLNYPGLYTLRLLAVSEFSTTTDELQSATLTVTNDPPTHTPPILVSSLDYNGTLEDLTAINQSTADNESDPINNIFQFNINGTSFEQLVLPFDGGSNDTFTRNYANNTLTVQVNSADWNAFSGRDGFGSYEFDGFDDFVNVSSDLGDVLEQNFTLSYWTKFSANGSDDLSLAPGLAGRHESAGSNRMYLGFIDSIGRIGMQVGGSSPIYTSILNDSSWHHIVLRRNSSSGEISVYVNGTLSANTSSVVGIVDTNFSILGGIEDSGGTDFFEGALDDVRLYNKTLSDEQISMLFNGSSQISSLETTTNESWVVCTTPNDRFIDGATLCSQSMYIQEPENTFLDALSEQDVFGYKTFVGDDVFLYANWTYDNGSAVSNGTCSATTFAGDINLTFDSGIQLWQGFSRYYQEGRLAYSVNCESPLVYPRDDNSTQDILSRVNLSLHYQSIQVADNQWTASLTLSNWQNYTEHDVYSYLQIPGAVNLTGNTTQTNHLFVNDATIFEIYFDNVSASSTQMVSLNITGIGKYMRSGSVGVNTSVQSSQILS